LTSPARRLSLPLGLVLLALMNLAGIAPATAHVDRTVPRPCLAPPVPQKKALPPPIGGAADPSRVFRGYDRDQLAPRSAPLGDFRVLALRVDFEDQPMDSSAAYFERLLLFLTEHYETTSGGQLRLQTTLSPSVYRLPQTMAWYGLDDSIGVREAVLCYDAVQVADPEVNFADYDQVVMFHAGPGQESDVLNNSPEQIWSVFFRKDDFAYFLPREGADRGLRTNDTTAEGDTIFVEDMGVFPEIESQDGFVFSPVGVVCHEFGHALGLPDLYDTTAPDGQIFAESQGVGSWDLMAAGTWNANGFVPAEFSAWSKVFVGWIDPVVVTSDSDVALTASALDRARGVVKIPIGGDEYFLIENRLQDYNGDGRFNYTETDSSTCAPDPQSQAIVCLFDFYDDSYANAEWDWWLPGEGTGSGLLIWHIDESVIADNIAYNTVNADPRQKGIDLEEADGIQDMDLLGGNLEAFGSGNDSFRAGWADRFTPDTEPNSDAYYGIRSGISIDQISAPGAVMTFRVRFAAPDEGWTVDLTGPTGNNHPALGDVDDDGAREIVVTDRDGRVWVVEPDGSATFGGDRVLADLDAILGTPLVADVNGDGIDDIVVPSEDGRIFGFAGPDGQPLGPGGSGVLVTSTNPMPGVELFGCNLNPALPGIEFGFGGAVQEETGLSRVEMWGVGVSGQAIRRGVASLHGGSGALPAVVADVDDDGRLELVASVRTTVGLTDSTVGSLQLYHLDLIAGTGYVGGAYGTAPLPDTAFYSAPVVGDLDRNGRLDVVVTGSDGFIYALEMDAPADGEPTFRLLPGWPRYIFASGEDEVSLADVDGNGYLEVLAIETGGVVHIFNYHGTSLVSLPEQVRSETRYFIEPQHAPLAVDITLDGRPELIVPLDDGQVFAVDGRGSRVGGWNFAGGGRGGGSPAVEDLDGDGTIELVTLSPWLDRSRLSVRSIGRGSGPPTWGAHRRSGARDGFLNVDPDEVPVVNGPTLDDAFAMPNPARESTRFHYRVGDGVDEVNIDIYDLLGRPVARLSGTTFAGTDNVVEWDLNDNDGRPVAPGVYLSRIQVRGSSGAGEASLKLAVLR
jgi:M6 family metalloprotease-like protein